MVQLVAPIALNIPIKFVRTTIKTNMADPILIIPINNINTIIINTLISKNPPFLNQLCNGVDLSSELNASLFQLDISILLRAKKLLGSRDVFINSPSFFNKLAGNSKLKNQIEKNASEKEIRKSWQPGLDEFKIKRAKYLIYPD